MRERRGSTRVTVAEAAHQFDISTELVNRLVEAGEFDSDPATRRTLIYRDSILDWFERRRNHRKTIQPLRITAARMRVALGL